MNDDYWNPAKLPFESDIGAGHPSSAQSEQRNRESAISERIAIRRAQDRSDPKTATRLLKRLAQQLSDGIPLSTDAAEFLGYALDRIAHDPTCAAACLGLVARRGRPRIGNVKRAEAMHEVRTLKSQKIPDKDGRNGDGAFTKAAELTSISASLIGRAWPDWKPFLESPDDSEPS
jgi:hypothetical protein